MSSPKHYLVLIVLTIATVFADIDESGLLPTDGNTDSVISSVATTSHILQALQTEVENHAIASSTSNNSIKTSSDSSNTAQSLEEKPVNSQLSTFSDITPINLDARLGPSSNKEGNVHSHHDSEIMVASQLLGGDQMEDRIEKSQPDVQPDNTAVDTVEATTSQLLVTGPNLQQQTTTSGLLAEKAFSSLVSQNSVVSSGITSQNDEHDTNSVLHAAEISLVPAAISAAKESGSLVPKVDETFVTGNVFLPQDSKVTAHFLSSALQSVSPAHLDLSPGFSSTTGRLLNALLSSEIDGPRSNNGVHSITPKTDSKERDTGSNKPDNRTTSNSQEDNENFNSQLRNNEPHLMHSEAGNTISHENNLKTNMADVGDDQTFLTSNYDSTPSSTTPLHVHSAHVHSYNDATKASLFLIQLLIAIILLIFNACN